MDVMFLALGGFFQLENTSSQGPIKAEGLVKCLFQVVSDLLVACVLTVFQVVATQAGPAEGLAKA
jgi:hypothetical protein